MSGSYSDEIGQRAVVNPVTIYDVPATMLQLLGMDHMDHQRLTSMLNGRPRRLSPVAWSLFTQIMT